MNCDSCQTKGIPIICEKCYMIIYLGGSILEDFNENLEIFCFKCHGFLSSQITENFSQELSKKNSEIARYNLTNSLSQKCEYCDIPGNIKNEPLTKKMILIDESCYQK